MKTHASAAAPHNRVMRAWGLLLVMLAGCEIYFGSDHRTEDDDNPDVLPDAGVPPEMDPNPNLFFKFCDASQAPVFFAYQSGTGAWRRATPTNANGAVAFGVSITEGRGGVLYVTRSSDEYLTEAVFGTTAELAAEGENNCAATQPTTNVLVTATPPTAGYVIASLGMAPTVFAGTTQSAVLDVPVRQPDLAASQMAAAGTTPDKIVIVRSLSIPQGLVLDFNGSPASVPATAMVTVANAVAGEYFETYVDLVTANSYSSLWFDLAPSPTLTRPWAGLSAAKMETGDFHGLTVFATPQNGTDDFRVAVKYVGAVTDQTLALGPSMVAPQVTQVSSSSNLRFRFIGTVPQPYNKGVSIEVAPRDGTGNAYSVTFSNAYLGGPNYDFSMPDLLASGLPLAARLAAEPYVVGANGFAFTGPGIFDLTPTLGGEFTSAAKHTIVNVQ